MHEAFLNISLPLFIRSNVECTWIIVGRIDHLQALHDKRKNNHNNRSWKGNPQRELTFIKILRRYQWWSLLLLKLNVICTNSNWLCWKTQEKFQVESRFCKTIGCSYVTLLTRYFVKKKKSKKTMFKVSNRNIRKRCLLTSKIILKTSEQSHLTTSYFPEVTVQNHVLDSFS